VKRSDHRGFFNAYKSGIFRGSRRGHAHQLPCQTPFPEKAALLQDCDNSLFALLRDDGELDQALLDIEYGIRRIPLRKENLLLRTL
jgi:hypothetical protein